MENKENLKALNMVGVMGYEAPDKVFNMLLESGEDKNVFMDKVVEQAMKDPRILNVSVRRITSSVKLYGFRTDGLYDMSISVESDGDAALHVDFSKAISLILEDIKLGNIDNAVLNIYKLHMDNECAEYVSSTIYDLVHHHKLKGLRYTGEQGFNNADFSLGDNGEIVMRRVDKNGKISYIVEVNKGGKYDMLNGYTKYYSTVSGRGKTSITKTYYINETSNRALITEERNGSSVHKTIVLPVGMVFTKFRSNTLGLYMERDIIELMCKSKSIGKNSSAVLYKGYLIDGTHILSPKEVSDYILKEVFISVDCIRILKIPEKMRTTLMNFSVESMFAFLLEFTDCDAFAISNIMKCLRTTFSNDGYKQIATGLSLEGNEACVYGDHIELPIEFKAECRAVAEKIYNYEVDDPMGAIRDLMLRTVKSRWIKGLQYILQAIMELEEDDTGKVATMVDYEDGKFTLKLKDKEVVFDKACNFVLRY